MNSYEEKQEARRARYEEKASRLRDEAHRLHDQAHEMASAIPFGQPILVGHHSEGRDRRYRDRIHNTFGKAFATMDKADYYEEKAAKVGSGGISSDDDALDKLNDKLETLRRRHEFMKAANAAIRKGKTPEAKLANLMALGVSEGEAQDILKPDFLGRVGFAPYSLQNSNANIRRVEQRIRELERAAAAESREEEGQGYTYREDTEENRIMFLFPGKPDDDTRQMLKLRLPLVSHQEGVGADAERSWPLRRHARPGKAGRLMSKPRFGGDFFLPFPRFSSLFCVRRGANIV